VTLKLLSEFSEKSTQKVADYDQPDEEEDEVEEVEVWHLPE